MAGPGPAGALLLGAAVACLLLARLTDPLVVTTKRLWTPPFAATVAAGVLLVIAVAHVLLDRDPRDDPAPTDTGANPRTRSVGQTVARWPDRALTWTLTALGRKSLVVYFGAQALMTTLVSQPLGAQTSWAHRIAQQVAIADNAALCCVLTLVITFIALAAVLHWRHIYLRP